MKTVIYWTTKATPNIIEKIRKHFGIPSHMSVSRETPFQFDTDRRAELEEIEQLGYIQIRLKK